MDFSSKNEEVLAKGYERRGRFEPEPDSAPVKAYQYWLEESRGGNAPKNENFCHFWRVVFIWAPWWWLLNHTVVPVGNLIGKGWNALNIPSMGEETGTKVFKGIMIAFSLVSAAILLMILISDPIEFLIAVGIIIGLGLLFAAIIVPAVYFADRGHERDREALELAWEAYYTGTGPFPYEKVESEPGRIKKFFKPIGELLVLAANVVRTKKWKICPRVTIPGVTD